jgi:hypothetical protein
MVWSAALDGKVAAPLPSEMLLDIANSVEHAAGWLFWSSPAGCCARQPADLANAIRSGLRCASDIGY